MWCSIQYYAHTHTHIHSQHWTTTSCHLCLKKYKPLYHHSHLILIGQRFTWSILYYIYIYIYNLSIVTTYMGTWWIWWMCPIWQIKTKQNKNNTYVIVYMVKIFPMFFSTRPVFLPITVSDSCSFQTGEESDEVFSCCNPSALRSSMVRCFSAHRGGYLSLNQAP